MPRLSITGPVVYKAMRWVYPPVLLLLFCGIPLLLLTILSANPINLAALLGVLFFSGVFALLAFIYFKARRVEIDTHGFHIADNLIPWQHVKRIVVWKGVTPILIAEYTEAQQYRRLLTLPPTAEGASVLAPIIELWSHHSLRPLRQQENLIRAEVQAK